MLFLRKISIKFTTNHKELGATLSRCMRSSAPFVGKAATQDITLFKGKYLNENFIYKADIIKFQYLGKSIKRFQKNELTRDVMNIEKEKFDILYGLLLATPLKRYKYSLAYRVKQFNSNAETVLDNANMILVRVEEKFGNIQPLSQDKVNFIYKIVSKWDVQFPKHVESVLEATSKMRFSEYFGFPSSALAIITMLVGVCGIAYPEITPVAIESEAVNNVPKKEVLSTQKTQITERTWGEYFKTWLPSKS
jgi:hypothetical protein